MKLIHIISLMICLSILVFVPVYAADTDPFYVVSVAPNTTYAFSAINTPTIYFKNESFAVQHGCAPFPAGTSDSPVAPQIYSLNNGGCVGGADWMTCGMDACTAGDYWVYVGWSKNSAWNYTIASWQTVPAGNQTGVTTWIQAVDGRDSSAIHGSNIQIKDVMRDYWVNTTNEQDGTSSITTNTTTTINAYAQATGYVDASRTGLTPADVVYELILWPTNMFLNPGPGNVNLAVIVNDKLSASPIESASVSVTVPSGATTGGATNAAGTETFVVPNVSVVHVTVSKTGYQSASKVITTSDFGPDTLRIELYKVVVTPTVTSTPLPGEVTARPTIDMRTASEKDQGMMDLIRNNGEALVQLAIVATFMGLLGLMTKSFK